MGEGRLITSTKNVSYSQEVKYAAVQEYLQGTALKLDVCRKYNIRSVTLATGVKMNDILKTIKQTIVTDLLDNGNSSKGIIKDLLETMNRVAVSRLLGRGYDYDSFIDSDGDFVLGLNYGAFYDRFVNLCKDNNVFHEVPPFTSFKKQLSKLGYCKYFNKATSFKDRYDGREKSKTFRAAVLEVEELRKRNVEVDYMLDRYK